MVKYNSTILLIAVIGLAVATSGCTNSNEQTQKSSIPTSYIPISTPASTSPPIVNQRSTLSFTEFYDAMFESDLTTLQKEELYVNKIFIWTGKVRDVTQDTVVINNEWCLGEGINRLCHPISITLRVDNDQKPKLNSLSKGSIITFEGSIKRMGPYFTTSIELYDGKIIG